MLLVHFDPKFENICGYICDDEATIEQNYQFVNFRWKNAEATIASNRDKATTPEAWTAFGTTVRKFFLEQA